MAKAKRRVYSRVAKPELVATPAVSNPENKDMSEPEPKGETFCRMVKVEVDNSHWPAYQGEVVHIVGDKVVKREFIDKPDMFENVYAKVADKIDPRGL